MLGHEAGLCEPKGVNLDESVSAEVNPVSSEQPNVRLIQYLPHPAPHIRQSHHYVEQVSVAKHLLVRHLALDGILKRVVMVPRVDVEYDRVGAQIQGCVGHKIPLWMWTMSIFTMFRWFSSA